MYAAYAYFDRNGVLKEFITDPAVRQGNEGFNVVNIYVEDLSFEPTTIGYRYTLINNIKKHTNQEYADSEVHEIQIPADKNRDYKYFKAGQKYMMYTIPVNEVEIPGNYALNVFLYNNNSLFNLSAITFPIVENYGEYDANITKSQFDYLFDEMKKCGRNIIYDKGPELCYLNTNRIMADAESLGVSFWDAPVFTNNTDKVLSLAYGNKYKFHHSNGRIWNPTDYIHAKKKYRRDLDIYPGDSITLKQLLNIQWEQDVEIDFDSEVFVGWGYVNDDGEFIEWDGFKNPSNAFTVRTLIPYDYDEWHSIFGQKKRAKRANEIIYIVEREEKIVHDSMDFEHTNYWTKKVHAVFHVQSCSRINREETDYYSLCVVFKYK